MPEGGLISNWTRRLTFISCAWLAFALGSLGGPAPGEGVPALRAAVSGHPATAPDGATPAEDLRFDEKLVPALLELGLERPVRVLDWPLAPGARRDLLLTRHDVYAHDVRIFRVEGEIRTETPRSSLAFLWGETEDAERSPVVVSIDPEAGTLHGYSASSGGWTEVRPAGAGSGEYVVAPSGGFGDAAAAPLGFECGEPTLAPVAPEPPDRAGSRPAPEAISTLHRATLAVDTDNEFMQLKFADNTTNATNYLASLFALMSVVYERDLLVRLLQGTTLLRVSSAPDPYNQSGTGNADSAKLDEFRTYWIGNYGSVPRAAAMMLSGKQGMANSASGIGYVNSLCSSSFGYTFSQVFKFPGSTAADDTLLVAHEIGHNFGSRHTHCYLTPTPIDTCYAGESGCYSGATSCPSPMMINGVPNVRGTLMSYCHLLSGCSASSVFHPRTVEILDPIVESKVDVCVFPAANPKEASPADDLVVDSAGGSSVTVWYTPACGATDHTVYAGNLATLPAGGISWSLRFCSQGTSGILTFDPGAASVYFVVAGNNGSIEGSYGAGTAGERPAAGSGAGCQYTQDLSGSCP